MPAGIQCFNQSGDLLVDITSRLARFVGSRTIDTLQSSGSVTDVGLSQGEVWYCFQPTQLWGPQNMDVSRPIFTVSGSTLSWVFNAGATASNVRTPGTVFYGVK